MATKKTATKKKPAKKAAKKSIRRYGAAARKQVKAEMHEMKKGKLKSGRSGKKVTSRKQATRHRFIRSSQEGREAFQAKKT